MFAYNKMSEEEVVKAANNLLEEGYYNWELASDGKFRVSSSGNPMVNLMLRMWDKDGKEHIVFDNLVGVKSLEYKTRHFCYSSGLSQVYEDGKFNESYCTQGLSGKAYVVVEPEREDKKTGKVYPPKNAVKDYVVPDANAKAAPLPETPELNDDIPF